MGATLSYGAHETAVVPGYVRASVWVKVRDKVSVRVWAREG